MKSIDKKAYYLVGSLLVTIMILLFFIPEFPYRVFFAIFITGLSAVALFFASFFEQHPKDN